MIISSSIINPLLFFSFLFFLLRVLSSVMIYRSLISYLSSFLFLFSHLNRHNFPVYSGLFSFLRRLLRHDYITKRERKSDNEVKQSIITLLQFVSLFLMPRKSFFLLKCFLIYITYNIFVTVHLLIYYYYIIIIIIIIMLFLLLLLFVAILFYFIFYFQKFQFISHLFLINFSS